MLEEKELKKDNQELLELHKRCLINHFVQIEVKHGTRKKFFRLYDMYISHKNIREYFFRDLNVFINALVTNRLEVIRDYFNNNKKKRKCTKKK